MPYVPLGDKWSVADEAVERAWSYVRAYKLDSRIFYRGKTPAEFLAYCQRPDVQPVFVAGAAGFVGMAWLTGIRGNTANAHFFVMPEYWGERARSYGKLCRDYFFSWGEQPLIEVLIGRIFNNNRPAIRFARDLGFSIAGKIPRVMGCGVTILYMENPRCRN